MEHILLYDYATTDKHLSYYAKKKFRFERGAVRTKVFFSYLQVSRSSNSVSKVLPGEKEFLKSDENNSVNLSAVSCCLTNYFISLKTCSSRDFYHTYYSFNFLLAHCSFLNQSLFNLVSYSSS